MAVSISGMDWDTDPTILLQYISLVELNQIMMTISYAGSPHLRTVIGSDNSATK